jgi:hypothetical protein
MKRAVYNRDLRASIKQTSTDFIETELDLALTFCKIAETTSDPETAKRNIENARRAYDSAKKALQKMRSDGEAYPSTIEEKFGDLAPMIGMHLEGYRRQVAAARADQCERRAP